MFIYQTVSPLNPDLIAMESQVRFGQSPFFTGKSPALASLLCFVVGADGRSVQGKAAEPGEKLGQWDKNGEEIYIWM